MSPAPFNVRTRIIKSEKVRGRSPENQGQRKGFENRRQPLCDSGEAPPGVCLYSSPLQAVSPLWDGHLAISEDIFWLSGLWWGWVEARDATKYPAVLRTSP